MPDNSSGNFTVISDYLNHNSGLENELLISGKTPDSKPRLLIILNRFVIGGQAVDTIPLAYHLKSHFNILILYGEKEEDELEATFLLQKYRGLKLKKIKSLRRSINPLNDIFAFFHVLLVIKNFKPRIVHTHGAKSGFVGRLAAFVSRVPVIIHSFHGHFFHSYFSGTITRIITLLERSASRITTAAIALSETQKNDISKVYKIFPAAKINVIPLGFEFDEDNNAEELRKSFRTGYGLKDTDVAVGIVGRIVAIKNHSFFVEVISQLQSSEQYRNAVFFIIGDGELKQSVEEDLMRRKILYSNDRVTDESRVVFTSWITGMYEVMNGLDIVALTSLNEGTPLSVIEAQFFRKPVVSTDVGGVNDTMEDNKTGFLIKNNDVNTFSKKLGTLIMDEALRMEMGNEGYKFASAAFSKDKEIESTREFYLSLLKNKGKTEQQVT